MATERDYFHDLAEDLVHGAEEAYVADLSEEMLDLLEQGMASEDRWAVVAMRFREAAMGVWARHTGAVTSQCERAFTRALEREDEAIVSSLASEFSAPAGLTNRAANEVMEASRGLAEIISRQNVALADNLADTWWRVTADAVTRTQMGDDPRDVMEDAVSFLSKAGLETIDYRSGQRTSIDAAVRRHTVTQANQCRNDLLVRQCEAYEVDLVFTSAHWGCRPTHAEWQGKPFSLHGTVEVDGVVYRDLAEATGYGTVWGLCGANCVVEGTLVSGPELSAAYRREYEGEVVAIRTALGHDLAVTPNHPVLTERGWVPAHEVKKGDHVFSRFLGDRVPPCVGPYEQHGEAAVEDVFDAAGNAFGVHALLGSAADFHGDGVFDQQVDVVLVDARLVADRETPRSEHFAEACLLDAPGPSGRRLGGGAPTEVLVASPHAPDGVVGGSAEVLTLLGGHPAEPGAHGVGPALGHDAVLLEPLAHGHGTDPDELRYACLRHAPFVESDDLFIVELLPAPVGGESELAQFIGNESVPASEVFAQLSDGGPFLVEPDEVVEVDVGMWSGHVYNLQTDSGWYFANTIVTHNCRHRLTPYVPGLSKLPDTDFKAFEEKYHMTSEEYYQATQRQRALERQVRATKREIALGQERGLDMTEARYRLGAQQARLREHCAMTGLPRDPERERAYGVRQQPRALTAARKPVMTGMATVSATSKHHEGIAFGLSTPSRVSTATIESVGKANEISISGIKLPEPAQTKPKSQAEIFLDAAKRVIGDRSSYFSAFASTERAQTIAAIETDLLRFGEAFGYGFSRDHNGNQAIVVVSPNGFVTLGAEALYHVVVEHGRGNITIRAAVNSIEGPIGTTEPALDDRGLLSFLSIGPEITTVINPDTGEAITAFDTTPSECAKIGMPSRGHRRNGREKRK